MPLRCRCMESPWTKSAKSNVITAEDLTLGRLCFLFKKHVYKWTRPLIWKLVILFVLRFQELGFRSHEANARGWNCAVMLLSTEWQISKCVLFQPGSRHCPTCFGLQIKSCTTRAWSKGASHWYWCWGFVCTVLASGIGAGCWNSGVLEWLHLRGWVVVSFAYDVL